MSAQNNEVNRTIDTETAEGHRIRVNLEEATDAGKRASTVRPSEGFDDEAEGHRTK
jgi:hypothetical protein